MACACKNQVSSVHDDGKWDSLWKREEYMAGLGDRIAYLGTSFNWCHDWCRLVHEILRRYHGLVFDWSIICISCHTNDQTHGSEYENLNPIGILLINPHRDNTYDDEKDNSIDGVGLNINRLDTIIITINRHGSTSN